MAILFALLAFIGWGVGDVFGTISSRKIGSTATFFWSHLLALIITSFYIPFAGRIESFGLLVLAFFLGLMNAYGTISYFRGLEKGNASLVGAIAGSFSLVTVLLSLVFFGEKVTFIQSIGVILAIAGVILASLDLGKLVQKKAGKIFSNRSVRFAFIPLFVWGIYFAAIRIPAEKSAGFGLITL